MCTEEKIKFPFKETSQGLLDFVKQSPTSFHAVRTASEMLEKEGFVRLAESSAWDLEPDGKYYVTRNGSSLIAFCVPREKEAAFRLFCSHTDSPSFKVKEGPQLSGTAGYTKLNVEQYGGALRAPWFDRPLSLAGRVLVQTGNSIETRLVQIDRDLLMIPSLAIHMNREANEGMKYNVQTDLCPVFGDESAIESLRPLIAREMGVQEEAILSMDLFLYNRQRGTFIGANEEFLAAPRLDDLQCMYGSLIGFLNAPQHRAVSVYGAFDNEETGSESRQGAASTFLADVLTRINAARGGSQEDYFRKYTSDGRSASVLKLLCRHANVPYQMYTNRSDMAGGSTLGNISNTQVSLQAVDIGLPQLAMHSPYEMAGTKDTAYLIELTKEFYSCQLEVTDEKMAVQPSEA